MNINEVYMLSDNLWCSYIGRVYPYLNIQTRYHAWDLRKGIIAKRPHLFTPPELSEDLFYWVEE